MDQVTIHKLAECSGYSVHALRGKVKRKQLIEGKHFVKAPDGRLMFSKAAFASWVNSNTNKGLSSDWNRTRSQGLGCPAHCINRCRADVP